MVLSGRATRSPPPPRPPPRRRPSMRRRASFCALRLPPFPVVPAPAHGSGGHGNHVQYPAGRGGGGVGPRLVGAPTKVHHVPSGAGGGVYGGSGGGDHYFGAFSGPDSHAIVTQGYGRAVEMHPYVVRRATNWTNTRVSSAPVLSRRMVADIVSATTEINAPSPRIAVPTTLPTHKRPFYRVVGEIPVPYATRCCHRHGEAPPAQTTSHFRSTT